MTGDRYLDACPPQFQSDAIDAVAEVSMIGAIRPVLFDGPPMAPPPWLDEVARPAAYVTFGTVSHFARPEILQSTVDAVSSVVADMIVTTGPNPVDRLSAPSARCHIERYLPQTLILPNVDVVVSNGGAGATLAAIYLGLPHVVIPQQPWSQLRNAQRIQALGIGIHVTDGSAPGAVAQATASALGDPSYRREAARLRDTLTKLPTPDAVLRRLGSAW
jgi:UDP:flavonoid glycosyltransferase YjiC (YdhE family)